MGTTHEGGSRRWLRTGGLVAGVAGLMLFGVAATAGASRPVPQQARRPRQPTASDGNVSGTPAPNNGTIQPGQGEELNVTVLNPDVVIDAVVVKGGNGYNVYSNPGSLPPTLPSPQHYISPFNGGGNVRALSHWFVCYHLTTPPPVGSLRSARSSSRPSPRRVGHFQPPTPPPWTATA